jgi:hypothetical protein
MKKVKDKYIHLAAIAVTILYLAFIVVIYVSEPRSLAEVPTKTANTIQNAGTKAQVVIGTYQIDQAKFSEGLAAFRQDDFVPARNLFERADPEHRDARTQFYIAYCFYRQGWGRVSNDDVLFGQGLDAVNKAIDLDPEFQSDDPALQLRTPSELKNELEEGLKVTPSDFNPLKVFRERK